MIWKNKLSVFFFFLTYLAILALEFFAFAKTEVIGTTPEKEAWSILMNVLCFPILAIFGPYLFFGFLIFHAFFSIPMFWSGFVVGMFYGGTVLFRKLRH